MLGHFLPGPFAVIWTFGAATFGGGGGAAGALLGIAGGMWLLGKVVRLLLAIGSGLNGLVLCGLLGFGSVSGCLRGV